jgi:LysM domain
VSFVTDANGLILQRDENDNNSSLGDPRELHYYFNGVRVGNEGTSDIDYVASIAAKTKAGSNTPFMNGTSYGQALADFDQSYDPINGFSVAGTGSSYTVNDGDTLQTIALAAWGDASLWYLIAQANGMTGAETLISGTVLAIPSKVTNVHNSASTFKPYDPNQAMGVSPQQRSSRPRSRVAAW